MDENKNLNWDPGDGNTSVQGPDEVKKPTLEAFEALMNLCSSSLNNIQEDGDIRPEAVSSGNNIYGGGHKDVQTKMLMMNNDSSMNSSRDMRTPERKPLLFTRAPTMIGNLSVANDCNNHFLSMNCLRDIKTERMYGLYIYIPTMIVCLLDIDDCNIYSGMSCSMNMKTERMHRFYTVTINLSDADDRNYYLGMNCPVDVKAADDVEIEVAAKAKGTPALSSTFHPPPSPIQESLWARPEIQDNHLVRPVLQNSLTSAMSVTTPGSDPKPPYQV